MLNGVSVSIPLPNGRRVSLVELREINYKNNKTAIKDWTILVYDKVDDDTTCIHSEIVADEKLLALKLVNIITRYSGGKQPLRINYFFCSRTIHIRESAMHWTPTHKIMITNQTNKERELISVREHKLTESFSYLYTKDNWASYAPSNWTLKCGQLRWKDGVNYPDNNSVYFLKKL